MWNQISNDEAKARKEQLTEGDLEADLIKQLPRREQLLLNCKPIIPLDGYVPNSVIRAVIGFNKPPKLVPDMAVKQVDLRSSLNIVSFIWGANKEFVTAADSGTREVPVITPRVDLETWKTENGEESLEKSWPDFYSWKSDRVGIEDRKESLSLKSTSPEPDQLDASPALTPKQHKKSRRKPTPPQHPSHKAKKKPKRRVSTVKSAKEEKRIFTSPELLVDSPALVCEDTLFSAPVTLISGTGTLIEELLVEENNEKEEATDLISSEPVIDQIKINLDSRDNSNAVEKEQADQFIGDNSTIVGQNLVDLLIVDNSLDVGQDLRSLSITDNSAVLNQDQINHPNGDNSKAVGQNQAYVPTAGAFSTQEQVNLPSGDKSQALGQKSNLLFEDETSALIHMSVIRLTPPGQIPKHDVKSVQLQKHENTPDRSFANRTGSQGSVISKGDNTTVEQGDISNQEQSVVDQWPFPNILQQHHSKESKPLVKDSSKDNLKSSESKVTTVYLVHHHHPPPQQYSDEEGGLDTHLYPLENTCQESNGQLLALETEHQSSEKLIGDGISDGNTTGPENIFDDTVHVASNLTKEKKHGHANTKKGTKGKSKNLIKDSSGQLGAQAELTSKDIRPVKQGENGTRLGRKPFINTTTTTTTTLPFRNLDHRKQSSHVRKMALHDALVSDQHKNDHDKNITEDLSSELTLHTEVRTGGETNDQFLQTELVPETSEAYRPYRELVLRDFLQPPEPSVLPGLVQPDTSTQLSQKNQKTKFPVLRARRHCDSLRRPLPLATIYDLESITESMVHQHSQPFHHHNHNHNHMHSHFQHECNHLRLARKKMQHYISISRYLSNVQLAKALVQFGKPWPIKKSALA